MRHSCLKKDEDGDAAWDVSVPEGKEGFVSVTNYKAKRPSEVSVDEGDLLEVLDNTGTESFMVCVACTGQVGWVPRVFIIKSPSEDTKKRSSQNPERQRKRSASSTRTCDGRAC